MAHQVGQGDEIFDFCFVLQSLKTEKCFIKSGGSRRSNGLFLLQCISILNQYFINKIHSYMPTFS